MHPNQYLEKIISQALKEDIGEGDLTTQYLISASATSQGFILLKENAVLCGLNIARAVFRKVDPHFSFVSSFHDGQKVPAQTKVAFLKGNLRTLLAAERVALNFLSHLSGIATKTSQFVSAVKPLKVQILDTRKTTPGLRLLEKEAVRCGGGVNHRFDLSEMILIKDNHISTYTDGSLPQLIRQVRKRTDKTIIIEVTNLKQFKEVLPVRPDIILLDNMKPAQVRKAVLIARKSTLPQRPLLEASGGITLKNVRRFAETGVERISLGEITHSHQAIDFSLEVGN